MLISAASLATTCRLKEGTMHAIALASEGNGECYVIMCSRPCVTHESPLLRLANNKDKDFALSLSTISNFAR
nr:MAG TPA: hypothetical protein [Caudoviricetes sp.]